ncbi:MAG: hypothetical protein GXP32_06520 [Kiritimatiellaeota bacterium]|nr:hypothetical protein [Kiritimatiellota bacterium]
MPKTNETLHCCVMRDISENDALAEELFAIEEYDYNSVFDMETLETRHILYFSNAESANSAKRLKKWDSARFALPRRTNGPEVCFRLENIDREGFVVSNGLEE